MALVRVAIVVGAVCAALVTAGTSNPGRIRPLRYIAIGDSFSSGEGVPPYREGTDRYLPPHDLCHRSYRAYPALIAGRRSSPGAWGFWACSGARVRDLSANNVENPVEIPQLDRIAPPGRSDPGVDLVTLTIGGNDAQFNVVWIGCLASRFAPRLLGDCQGRWRTFVADAINRLRAQLPAVLRRLRARAPRARILVLGYPDPFPTVLPALTRCSLWFRSSDLQWLAREATALNRAIRDATSAAAADVTYVEPTGFQGHDVCSPSPWFNGIAISPGRLRGSFHPNALGQRQLARNVLAVL